jgi:hypothetical protein
VDRIAYTEWRFALPRELSRGQYIDAAHDFLDAAFGDRNPYVYAVHAPQANDGGAQPHVHVLWSGRVNDGIDRTAETYFRRPNATHPERGGALKDPWTYHKGSVKASRVQYTDVMNSALERYGHAARLHPDTLDARGIDYRKPEQVLRSSDSNALKYHGRITKDMEDVLRTRAERQRYEKVELAQAQAYWIQRSQELGITRTMTPTEQRARIKEARQQRVTQIPKHDTGTHVEQLTAEAKAIVKLAAALKIERAIEERYAKQGKTRPAASVQRMERLLAAVGDPQAARRVLDAPQRPSRHTPTPSTTTQRLRSTLKRLGREDHEGAGAALRIRLHEEEERKRQQERDHGMSF